MTKKSFNASVLPRMRAFASRLVGRGDCVLVGLSGGADSVCLLHFLRYLAAEKHFSLAAAHINHGLRGKAATADQRFCRQLCKDLDIEFLTLKTNAKATAERMVSRLQDVGITLIPQENSSYELYYAKGEQGNKTIEISVREGSYTAVRDCYRIYFEVTIR